MNKRLVTGIIEISIGIVLIVLSFMQYVDEYWNGMGSAFLVIGCIQVIRHIRLSKNIEYRERYETELHDERNHYIRNKAWAWAGYLYVMIMAVLSIVLKIVGYEDLSILASFTVCLVLILFYFSYYYLRKKY